MREANMVDSIGLAGPKIGAGIGAKTSVFISASVTSCGIETKLAPCLEPSASW